VAGPAWDDGGGRSKGGASATHGRRTGRGDVAPAAPWDAYRALMVPLGSTVDTDDFCMMTSTGLSASSETSTVT